MEGDAQEPVLLLVVQRATLRGSVSTDRQSIGGTGGTTGRSIAQHATDRPATASSLHQVSTSTRAHRPVMELDERELWRALDVLQSSARPRVYLLSRTWTLPPARATCVPSGVGEKVVREVPTW